jgi:uncharacterized protein YaaR (DUF327 family)
MIRENINISVKPWFDKGCSKLVYQRKLAKMQWLQDPSKIDGDNLNKIRHETSRQFKNTKTEYLKNIINELATNSTNKNIKDDVGFNPSTQRHYRRLIYYLYIYIYI